MKKKLKKLEKEFDDALAAAASIEKIEAIRVDFLGRKGGRLTELLKGLKDLPTDEKKIIGPLANNLKKKVEAALEKKGQEQSKIRVSEDLSLPGIQKTIGTLHPMTIVQNDLIDIFRSMGFMVLEGPELDNDFYNFEGLNFPPDHPARDIQDTFFVKTPITRKESRNFNRAEWLMRTQTSNMQVRTMEKMEPPLRAIVPARVFRNEATDATHEHTFYQLEGFVVDKNITVGQLLWTLKEIFRQLYQKEVKLRLRPGYFPFVEPGYEIDMYCVFCKEEDTTCKVCKGLKWVEMGGSGMIHPNVLDAAGYEPGKYTGFAFGMGINRIAMLRYGINDIRMFMENDIRFLEQF